MKKLLPVILVLLFIPAVAFAHSGGTDANGGHHDYNNVSGLGDYHYHHGYGPHLHPNGICPYDNAPSSDLPTISDTINTESFIDDYVGTTEESYTMTESELQDYVHQSVNDDPEEYNMISLDEYSKLQRDYELLEKRTITIEESREDVMMGVGFTAMAGALACYLVYKKCKK